MFHNSTHIATHFLKTEEYSIIYYTYIVLFAQSPVMDPYIDFIYCLPWLELNLAWNTGISLA